MLAPKLTVSPYPVTPRDGSAVPLAAPVGIGFLAKLTARVLNGTTVNETTTGSDDPPLTQLTEVGSALTVYLASLTLTLRAGRSV